MSLHVINVFLFNICKDIPLMLMTSSTLVCEPYIWKQSRYMSYSSYLLILIGYEPIYYQPTCRGDS